MSTLKFNVEADWQEVQKLRSECERLEKQLSTMDDATKSSDLGKSVTTFYEQQKKALDGLTDSLIKGSVSFLKETNAMFDGAKKGRIGVTQDLLKQSKDLQPLEEELKTTATSMDELESRLGKVTSAMAENKNMATQNKAVYDDLTRSLQDYKDIVKYAEASDNATLAMQTKEWSIPAVEKELTNWLKVQESVTEIDSFLKHSEETIRAQGVAMKEQVISFKTICDLEASRPAVEKGNIGFGNLNLKTDKAEQDELLKLTDELIAKGKEYKQLDPFSSEAKQAAKDIEALGSRYNEIMLTAKGYTEEVERQNKGLKSQLITTQDIEGLEKGINENSKVNGVKLQFENQDDLDEANKVLTQLVAKGREYQDIKLDTPEGKALYKTLEGLKGQWDDLMKKAYEYSKMQTETIEIKPAQTEEERPRTLEDPQKLTEIIDRSVESLSESYSKFGEGAKSIAELNAQMKASVDAFSRIENLTDRNYTALGLLRDAQEENVKATGELADKQKALEERQKALNDQGEISNAEMLKEAEAIEKEKAALDAQEKELENTAKTLEEQIKLLEGNNAVLKYASDEYDKFNAKVEKNGEALKLSTEFYKERKKAIEEETQAKKEDAAVDVEGKPSKNLAQAQVQRRAGGALMYFDIGEAEEYDKLIDEIKKKQAELQGMDLTSDAGKQAKEDYEALNKQLSDVIENALQLGRDMQSAMQSASEASKDTRASLGAMKNEVESNSNSAKAMAEQFSNSKATGEELKAQLENISAALEKNKKASEDNEKALKKLETAQKKLQQAQTVAYNAGDSKSQQQASDQIKQINEEITIRRSLGKQLDENNEQLNACKEQIDGLTESVGGSEQKMVSYQTQIRQMVMQLAQMEMAGQRGTAEYIALQNKLGELSATMAGARAQMKAFAQPYPGLAATTGLISDMSSAVKVGAGIWGMFSAETEEAQKILVKLQSVMSIANGLQEVANKLNKNNATSILLMSKGQERWNKLKSIFNKTQQAENAATAGNTAAQNANTLAKNANAASQQTKNAATATGTAETIGNTGAEVANTAAAEGLTIANFTLAGAFKAVGTAILGIPAIGWIVGAVAGLATLISYLTEYEREQKKVEKAGREAAAVTQSHMDVLTAQWANLSDDASREQFIQDNQKAFEDLGKEIHSVADFENEFSEANQNATKEMANLEEQINQNKKALEEYGKDLSTDWTKRKISKNHQSFDRTFGGRKDPTTGEEFQYDDFATKEEKRYNETQKKIVEQEARLNELRNRQTIQNNNARIVASKETEKAEFDIERQKIENMEDGYAKEYKLMENSYQKEAYLSDEDYKEAVKKGQKEIELWTARRQLLELQHKKDQEDLKRRYAEQLETSLTSLVRAHATVLRYQQQLRNEEAQGEINLIKNQFDKQQKQEELNHKQNLDNIQKRHDEVYDQIVENARKEFEAREANNESEAIKNGGTYERKEWLKSDEYKNAKSQGEVEANKFVNTMLEQEEARHNEAMKELNIQLLEAEESNSRALQKIKADLVKIDDDLSNQRAQAEINAMKAGGLKSLMQAQQNYEQQKKQLEANNKDYIQKIIDAKKQEFEAQEKENEINAKKNGTSYERQDWQTSQAHTDAIEEANKKGAEKLTADTVDINQSYNDEVRKIIEQDIGDLTTVNEKLKQTQKNLKGVREALEKQHNSGEVSDEEYENGLANLDFEEIKQQLDELNEACGGSLMDYFSKFSSETQNTIKTLKSKLEAELKNLKSLEVVTPEQVGRMQEIEDELHKLKKQEKNIDKVSKAFGKMGNSIAGIGDSLDDLIGGMDDTGKAAFNLVETTLKAAEQLCDQTANFMENTTKEVVTSLKTMESACFILAVIDAIMQVISAFANMFSGKSSMELYEEEEAKAEQYMDTLDRVKEKRLEVADSAVATTKETIDAYQDAIDITETEIEAQRKLAKEYANARDKGSHTAGYTSYQNQTASSWQQAADALNMDVSSLKSMMGGRMEGLYDLSMDQIEALMNYAPEFLAELDSDMYDYLMTIYDLGDECKDLAEEMQEAIAGISFDDMYENFRDVLMDMDSDMNDFTDTINDMLKNSISQYVMSKDKDLWQNWYEEYTKMVEDENWDAADALVEEAKNIYAREREEMDDITSSISSLSESSQGDATTAAFQTMSEDTASELSARFLALFEVGSRIETATQDDMNTRSVEMADLTSVAQLQVEQLIGLNSIADESRTFLADSFLELQSITENTEKIVENTKYIKQWTYDTKVNTSRL